MVATITYHSINANPSECWMAYVVLPNGKRWDVQSLAATEEVAIEKLVKLYESEIVKYAKCDVSHDEPVTSGRGAHFVGKVWMIHSFTRNKIRVDASEVEKYEAEGYIKGGPRSK